MIEERESKRGRDGNKELEEESESEREKIGRASCRERVLMSV